MNKKLTLQFCTTVQASGDRDEYVDDHPNSWNLMLRVSHTAKSWMVRYRFKNKWQKMSLGQFPGVSLDHARRKSLEIAAQVADGIDPAQAERDAEAASMTLEAVVNEYIEQYCKRHLRSWKLRKRIFENWVLPSLGKKALPDVKRGVVLELVQGLEAKGLTSQVNRVLAVLKSCLSWAVEERQYLEYNPIATLFRRKRPVKEVPRDRILNRKELRAIWLAADRLPEPSSSFIKILMLTGQRRDEVRCLEWPEIDLEDKIWILPARRNKAARTHVIPMTDAVLEILEGLPKFEEGDFVFSISGRKPYAGTRRLKSILDRESKVTDWVFHDIRRTFSTTLSSLKIEPHIRRRCLNHAAATGLDKVYDQYDLLEEKRAAMQAWSEYLRMCVGENVVRLKSA